MTSATWHLQSTASVKWWGASGICHGSLHAFLWENGGPMVDLNTLMFPKSEINVISPFEINDRGEIAAQAVLPNGDQHAVLLVQYSDCDDECDARIAESENNAAASPHPAMTQQGSERGQTGSISCATDSLDAIGFPATRLHSRTSGSCEIVLSGRK
ncbi:MAG: hypothetical protein WA419_15255 [Silvibacterium sp.]